MEKVSVFSKLKERDLNSHLATVKVELPSGLIRLYPEESVSDVVKACGTVNLTLYKLDTNNVAKVIDSIKVDYLSHNELTSLREELENGVRITVSGKVDSTKALHGLKHNAEVQSFTKKDKSTSLDF